MPRKLMIMILRDRNLHNLQSLYEPVGPDFKGIAKNEEGNVHDFGILKSGHRALENFFPECSTL
jgi:hypothetical protein